MIIPYVQQFSGDGLIRVPLSSVHRMNFDHLYTELLASSTDGAQPRCAGMTEWTAKWMARSASLAWDWSRLDDGALVESFECPIRTNLMVTDEKGYDLGHAASEVVLQDVIRQVAWRKSVETHLLSEISAARSQGCTALHAGTVGRLI